MESVGACGDEGCEALCEMCEEHRHTRYVDDWHLCDSRYCLSKAQFRNVPDYKKEAEYAERAKRNEIIRDLNRYKDRLEDV